MSLARIKEICQRNAGGRIDPGRESGSMARRPLHKQPHIGDEIWLAKRAGRIDLFAGVTDYEEGQRRLRDLLLPIALQIAGKSGGQRSTFAECYQRLYGEPLVQAVTQTRQCAAHNHGTIP